MLFKRITALFLAGTFALTMTACRKSGPEGGGKIINYNLSAEPKTLDPQIDDDPNGLVVIQALYEGLARISADGKAVPGAAEKWSRNADATQYTFTLRPGVKWSDGTPLTAEDFVYAFQRALSPSTGSTTCTKMYCIKNAKKVKAGLVQPDQLGATAKDADTLVVDLETSTPNFPELTASPVFMPCKRNFFQGTAGRYGLDEDCILGNGPFKIDGKYGWDHGKTLNLKRSSTYKGQNAPLPTGIAFSIGGSDTITADPVAALKNGTVDAVLLPYADIADAKAAGCTVLSYQDTTWGLCMNTQSNPMKNSDIRKAFLQAFNRSKVLSHLPKNAAEADDILLPSTNLSGKNYRSLAGGGFYLRQSSNAAGMLQQGLRQLGLSQMDSVDVLCPDDTNVKLMLNEMIVAWNAQFQNYFNMDALSEKQLKSRVASGDYQMAIFPLTPGGNDPESTLALFESNSQNNPAKWKDTAYDSLLDSVQGQTGPAAAEKYAEAEKYLNQQAVFYPLYYEKHYFALAKGVTGVCYHPLLGSVDFINAGKS